VKYSFISIKLILLNVLFSQIHSYLYVTKCIIWWSDVVKQLKNENY